MILVGELPARRASRTPASSSTRSCRPLPFVVNFGKLWRPSGKSSTYISQSVIWIASKTMRRVKSVLHGIETSMRFASRNGRDFGVMPSMVRSSTTKVPRQRWTESRPMCIGRLR